MAISNSKNNKTEALPHFAAAEELPLSEDAMKLARSIKPKKAPKNNIDSIRTVKKNSTLLRYISWLSKKVCPNQ